MPKTRAKREADLGDPGRRQSFELATLELSCINDNAKAYLRDVLDHVLRVERMISGLREVITPVFEASNLLEQRRHGTITRQLAAWAEILALRTVIAGI